MTIQSIRKGLGEEEESEVEESEGSEVESNGDSEVEGSEDRMSSVSSVRDREYLPSDDEVVPPSEASTDSYPYLEIYGNKERPHRGDDPSNDKPRDTASKEGGHESYSPEEDQPGQSATNDLDRCWPHQSDLIMCIREDEPEEVSHAESHSPEEDPPQPGQSIITVKTTTNVDGRKYDKKYVCFYCDKPQTKLPRHLQSAHSQESAVSDWMAEKDDKLRSAKLTKLRNLGNHMQNCKVLKEERGELIVKYRPTVNVDPRDFVPCPTCYGYYAKKFLWKHSCPLETVTGASRNRKRGQRVRNGTLLLPSTSSSQSGVEELLLELKNDNISRVIKSDKLILMLARKENAKHGHDPELRNYSRTKLREIARLVVETRVVIKDPNATLTSLVDPAKYNSVVTALKNVAGFDSITHKYKVPSLALKLGQTLKKCATILKAEGLITGNDVDVIRSTKFLEVCDVKLTEDISIHAHRTLTEEKRNKAKRLPLAADIMRLTTYLKETAQVQKDTLRHGTTVHPTAWMTLNELTLTQVMLFNRRRQGEISKMSLNDYESKSSPDAEDHLYDSLSDFEKELCKKLKRAEIVGKKGRTVPVLITNDMEESMSLLVSKRKAAGVNDNNKFMFPCGTGVNHIRGADCIRKFSVLCGAKHPNYLRSTGLRKQVACVSQVLNLKENELDILANFLGHDVRIHREYYRLPDSTLQVAKVSKLLMSLETGTTTRLAGKSLDEIEINEDEGKLSHHC